MSSSDIVDEIRFRETSALQQQSDESAGWSAVLSRLDTIISALKALDQKLAAMNDKLSGKVKP